MPPRRPIRGKQNQFVCKRKSLAKVEAQFALTEDMLGQQWTGGGDEDVERDYLRSRVAFWETLPYDWMEMHPEDLDSMNLMDYSPEISEAYRRSRADPSQYDKYAQDYERYDRIDAWSKSFLSQSHPGL